MQKLEFSFYFNNISFTEKSKTYQYSRIIKKKQQTNLFRIFYTGVIYLLIYYITITCLFI